MIVVSTVLRAIRPALAGATVNGRWTPGIGDPTILGWVTVFGYALAVVLCVRAMLKAKRASTDASAFRVVLFWGILAGILCFLCINKQLDLQSWFTHVGKALAMKSGWYEERRAIQSLFILAILVGGVGLMGFFVWLIHGHFRQHALALAGTAFLVCFVLVRASSIHYVDIMLFQWKSAQGISINNVMELGGILCVIASAARNRDVV